MKKKYTRFILIIFAGSLMSFAPFWVANSAIVIGETGGMGKDCHPQNVLMMPCGATSLTSQNEFQAQKRSLATNELIFSIRFNKAQNLILEFKKSDAAPFVETQTTRIKYFTLKENLVVDNPTILTELGTTQNAIILPKGVYPMSTGLFNYAVEITPL